MEDIRCLQRARTVRTLARPCLQALEGSHSSPSTPQRRRGCESVNPWACDSSQLPNRLTSPSSSLCRRRAAPPDGAAPDAGCGAGRRRPGITRDPDYARRSPTRRTRPASRLPRGWSRPPRGRRVQTACLTVTLHAPQVHGFFSVPVDHMNALEVLSRHFTRKQRLANTVVVSPDLGHAKEASHFARSLNLPVAAGSKRRLSDDRVGHRHAGRGISTARTSSSLTTRSPTAAPSSKY